ncbi:hypothetical cyanophage protein [Synechococcus phage S-CRM01]|uniref:hypothetical cyanophage protein n=1 Tax=Synechococcus phage S-CRM01 TaxID=1026955 RepID=UPI000209E36B|nr:hypothetical cyanophage protein [Synechococcus phage S-CRM01]AEC53012.1 hypothetical cyanophage protein [Synechococcus phage S-CRM01]
MEKSVSRQTLYSVRIGGGKVSDEVNSYLDFFCSTTAIPSVSLQTLAAVGQEHQGIVRETPGALIFSKPFSMQIIENSDYLTYTALRNWLNEVSPNANQALRPGSAGRSIRMNYYNSIISNIELTKLEFPDEENQTYQGADLNKYYKTPLKINLINAYPIAIGEINLQSSAADQLVYWDAQFTYESYTIVNGLDLLRL